MHNIALELQRNGHEVTGSDDEIFEPSKSRLEKAGLLPQKMGWNPDSITSDIDVIILGMHARVDNPELLKAQKLGLKIESFPEFVANQCGDKTRVVVAGSHGKTSTTAMIMHVLRLMNKDFDYLVGSKLDGFDLMVKLSDAPIIILEGDEYLSSPIDRRSKFVWYKPHIAIVTGVAWDHINVFPTFEGYCDQFSSFAKTVSAGGSYIYYDNDEVLERIAREVDHVNKKPYHSLNYSVQNGDVVVEDGGKKYTMSVFGKHNLENMHAAVLTCVDLGVSREDALQAMTSFTGTSNRLEKVFESDDVIIFRDFAHSPSKVKATVDAVKSTFSDYQVVAVLELHTFSSLNAEFLPLYKDTMKSSDDAFVHFNRHVFELKKMPVLNPKEVQDHFGNVQVETDLDALWNGLKSLKKPKTVYLMMSSGNFGGKRLLDLVGH